MALQAGAWTACLAVLMIAGLRCGGSGEEVPVSYWEPPETAIQTLRGEYEEVAAGFEFITSLTTDPSGRIFLTEFRTGAIKVLTFSESGEVTVDRFAEVPLPMPEQMQGEQGLWTLAVHPEGTYLYASATASLRTEDAEPTARIVRFPILEDGSAGPLEEICGGIPSKVITNGGALAFGPDGLLYLSIGDLGDQSTAANTSELLAAEDARSTLLSEFPDATGVILRMPPDGCFQEAVSFGDFIYASGFRNPYGMTFAADGTMYATDAGPSCCDKVLRVEPGGNHGWPRYGLDPEDLQDFLDDPSVVDPLTHSGRSTFTATQIVYFDEDTYQGELRNSLVYGAFHIASLMRIQLSQDGRQAVLEEVLLTLPTQLRDEFVAAGGINGVAIGADGHIYFASLDTVYRLTAVPPIEP